ncbi:pentatricopeptide repeat-containing protein At1g09220, mitochondrial [Amborella trichopoda]|uniref:pentatricopeptide repeat-containing protein At1g09220, mitochondrial n=1 Tax=Amborella trichopoda TaxID=13333 RepID=UPI0009C043F7|nr:pentatricopeptide repeat-containing protein At1g09220, mitochondrial [Amborella trichopoda]XP_020517163.1 pentatricopeptide repeat-containing protein At1g09220, mitochondrial [Amborella trichopoda]|eukprot:XP_011629103.2 pentatricopeptide repeat-containing protein At1g09220, mitochondrial [Amborella trichopoda]
MIYKGLQKLHSYSTGKSNLKLSILNTWVTKSISHYSASKWRKQESVDTKIPSLERERLFSLLNGCLCTDQIRQVHSQLIMSISESRLDAIIWNSLLGAYARSNTPQAALIIYKQMQNLSCPHRDRFTYSFLLKACTDPSLRDKKGEIHCHIIKTGFHSQIYVRTSLLVVYSTSGCLSDACKVFNEMPKKNVVICNAMITGYGKHGKIDDARKLFDEMMKRSVVSWSAMIDGYITNNRTREAFALFRFMLMEENENKPNEITILSILPALQHGLGASHIGDSIHAFARKMGFHSFVPVSNALIDMYAKCGSIANMGNVFDEIQEKSVVSWTCMISAYAMHGHAKEAIRVFKEMEGVGVRANGIAFLGLLHACSHAGLIKEGQEYFTAMVEDYGIVPGVKHYGCMIDMLGRAGLLEEAEKMLERENSLLDGNVVVWRTLLGACCVHGAVGLAERVMERVVELEREFGGDYVLLSNIYAGAGRWSDAEKVRRSMEERNLMKTLGSSNLL